MRTGSAHIAPSSAARWEIDLSGGGVQLAAQAAARRRRRRRVHVRATGPGRARPPARARARPRALAADPQRDLALADVRRRATSAMSTMLTPARAERERELGDHARAGWAPRRAARHRRRRPGRPPAARRRSSRGRVVPARRAPRRRRRPACARASPQPRDRVVERRDQRVGVGEVDVAPRSPGWRPATRVASRKLGPIGRQRARGAPAPSARAAWATSTLASTCGRWRDRSHQAVVRRRRRSPPAARRAPASSRCRRSRGRPRCGRSASGTRSRRRTGPRARARRRRSRRPPAGGRR